MHWLPESASTYSPGIDTMFYVILWVTGTAFVLTEAILFYFMLRYRARQGVRASFTHGNSRLEMIWTIVPAVMLVFLGLSSKRVWGEIKGSIPPTDQEIVIIASQFDWEIHYKGVDGQLDTPDDVVIHNEMSLPVHKPTKIRLRSKDVIHSFFVPAFRLKQDAVPGLTIDVWVEPTKTGMYEIACAELCGFGHGTMRGQLTVLEPDEFQKWLKDQEANVAPAEAAPAEAAPGAAAPAEAPPEAHPADTPPAGTPPT